MTRSFTASYDEKSARSLPIADLRAVLQVVTAFDKATREGGVFDASVTIADDATGSNPIAEAWWDSEHEEWVIDFGVMQ